MKPNLFTIATKELVQDAFFTWLIQWADNDNSKYDRSLHETAKDFVRLLLGKGPTYPVGKVRASRQWYGVIDIWVEVNDAYFIVIEDKVNAREHGNQLTRYKELVTKHYKDKPREILFVYLKTGNESLAKLNDVQKKGYTVVDRKSVLGVLNVRNVQHEAVAEYQAYLSGIERETVSYNSFLQVTSSWRAAEGFFLKL